MSLHTSNHMLSDEDEMSLKVSNSSSTPLKLEDQIDIAWKDYSLDAPRLPNPIPTYTQGLRRICMVIHLILPLTKIIFGARFIQSCPASPWIPTYMIVGGILQLGFLVVLIYKPLRQPALLGIIGVSVLIWMLIASMNIIVEWKPDFFLGGWRYCNRVFFYFAFFVSVSEYIIITVLLLYVCMQFAYYSTSNSNNTQFV